MVFPFYLQLSLICIFSFSLSPTASFSQNNLTPQQLLEKIKSTSDDSIKVELLLKLSSLNRTNAPEKSIEYAQKGLVLTQKHTKDWAKNAQIKLYALIGHAHRMNNKFELAKNRFGLSLHLAIQQKDSAAIGDAYSDLATVYADLEQYDSTTIFDLKALKFREKIKSPKIGLSYNNLGYDYKKQSLFNQALIYYLKAVEQKKKQGLNHTLGNTYLNIGNIYEKSNQLDSTFFYYEEALKNAIEINDSLFIGQVLHSIGLIHAKQGNNINAQNYLSKALKIFNLTELSNSPMIVPTYQELAKVQIAINKLKEAENLLLRSHEILVQNKMEISYGMESNFKAFELLYWTKEDFVKAHQYAEKSYALLDTLSTREKQQQIYKLLAEYQNQLKESKIKTLEQEKQIQHLEYEKLTRQRLYFGLVIILMFLLVGILFWVNRWRAKTNQELKDLNHTKDKLFSIIAHDLKNPLSAFCSITQALSDDIFNISRENLEYFIKQLNSSAHSLFDLLQNLLHWSISQSGRLEFIPESLELKDSTERIIDLLQNSANIKEIQLVNHIPIGTIVYADSKMLHAVLQNLIANAIKFTPHKGTIRIDAKTDKELTIITVEDTGSGMSAETLDDLFKIKVMSNHSDIEGKGTGLGLVLCKELVERHGGKIWAKSILNEGSIFSFTLPHQ